MTIAASGTTSPAAALLLGVQRIVAGIHSDGLVTAQRSRCFKETLRGCPAAAQCATAMEEQTWRRAIGKVRDGIHTRAPKSFIRTPRTIGARTSTARGPRTLRIAGDPNTGRTGPRTARNATK